MKNRPEPNWIDPVLFDLGWSEALIHTETTPGGVDIIDGVPSKRKGRTDYLLCVPVGEGRPPSSVRPLILRSPGHEL
ncbi:MAG: hypothetical protein SWH68_12360 [Thermodesulfobacteriota bacterium]|nr:hypothetical protein [Thermodesulfobacteriota bacterium]